MLKEDAISRIEQLNMSTAEVADAIYKTGWIQDVKPINSFPDLKVGPVHFIYATNGSNYTMHKQAANAPEGSIVFIKCIDWDRSAAFGHLVTTFLMRKRKVKAIVTDGPVRDSLGIISEKFPVWSKGTTPIGAANEFREHNSKKVEAAKNTFEDGIMVCDHEGVVFIKENLISSNLMYRLKFLKDQEKDWYDKLEKDWNTFEIVCKKEKDASRGI